jgi:hypothetical protein
MELERPLQVLAGGTQASEGEVDPPDGEVARYPRRDVLPFGCGEGPLGQRQCRRQLGQAEVEDDQAVQRRGQ